MRRVLYMLIACLLVFSGTAAYAGETGTALKADDIKAEPYRDAKTVGKLTVGGKVDIVKRDGGWFRISAPKKGWVKMLSIKKGTSSKTGVTTSGVTAVATGRAGTGKVVSTTGVRGLNEEELKNAHFDEDELKLDESYAASKEDAAKFAAKAKLKARKLGYLPE